VRPGDNLWVIARARLAEATGRRAAELSNGEIAGYWLRVVDANRGRLRSGDPDLIYPGEDVELPPVSGG
jgi:nucleoid-associated protein YgaU